MEQQKVGSFLKQLRHEKGLTQEQLAEQFQTTNRSVSRWENGRTLPDISLLVELADFYDVDVRELLEGERKSEVTKEEVNEVASKLADYAEEQKGRLLIGVRCISLVGVFLMAVVLAFQTFRYEPGIVSFLCYACSLAAFVITVVLALYTNNLLEKIASHKKFIVGCKMVALVAIAVVIAFVVRVAYLIVLVIFAESAPGIRLSGIENYNKTEILETYGGDIDSGLFVFPEDTEAMVEPCFTICMRTGLFDTDGYIMLHTRYEKEQYDKELERLSGITCTVSFGEENVIQKIQYDEESYRLPAYVASDGFDSVYEYALVNEKTHEISYILLSYPKVEELSEYKDYLKQNVQAYDITDALNRFTIYAYSFDGGESWMEYSDVTKN